MKFLLFGLLALAPLVAGAKQISLAGGDITFAIPDNFTPLDAKKTIRVFPEGPTTVYADPTREAVIGWTLTHKVMAPQASGRVEQMLITAFRFSYAGLKWIRTGSIDLNGTGWNYLEMVVPGDHPLHLIEIQSFYQGSVLVFFFSSPERRYNEVQDVLTASLRGVTVRNGGTADYLLHPAAGAGPVLQAWASACTAEIRGDWKESIAACRQILALAPNDYDARLLLGETEERMGDFDAAIADDTEAARMQPDLLSPYLDRSIAEMADLRCDDALADIARVMAQRPAQSPDLISDYYRRGVVECEQGRLDLGLADYNRALAMQARAPAVLAERGLVYLTQGDLDKAASDLRQAISLAPQDDGSIYDYACLEVVRGGMSHFAQRDLQEIVDKKRKVRGVESSYLLLWVLKAGDGEEAAATVELATYLDDDSFPKSTWARDLGAFLVGRMSERELLAATRSPNPIKERVQLCRAWYFIGVKRRLGGDLAGAATAFHHCVAQDERYWEYDLFARTELAHGLNHLSPLDRALSVLQRSLPREGPSPGVLTLFVVSASAGFLLIGGVFVSALWPERSRLHSTPPPSQPEL